MKKRLFQLDYLTPATGVGRPLVQDAESTSLDEKVFPFSEMAWSKVKRKTKKKKAMIFS